MRYFAQLGNSCARSCRSPISFGASTATPAAEGSLSLPASSAAPATSGRTALGPSCLSSMAVPPSNASTASSPSGDGTNSTGTASPRFDLAWKTWAGDRLTASFQIASLSSVGLLITSLVSCGLESLAWNEGGDSAKDLMLFPRSAPKPPPASMVSVAPLSRAFSGEAEETHDNACSRSCPGCPLSSEGDDSTEGDMANLSAWSCACNLATCCLLRCSSDFA
jgi:hypothetical protein